MFSPVLRYDIWPSNRKIGDEPRRSGGYACGKCGAKPKFGHLCPFKNINASDTEALGTGAYCSLRVPSRRHTYRAVYSTASAKRKRARAHHFRRAQPQTPLWHVRQQIHGTGQRVWCTPRRIRREATPVRCSDTRQLLESLSSSSTPALFMLGDLVAFFQLMSSARPCPRQLSSFEPCMLPSQSARRLAQKWPQQAHQR